MARGRRTLPPEMVARARKALLLGVFTFGVAGWFVVGRKGWGIFTGVLQVVCLPFSIFVFPFMLCSGVLASTFRNGWLHRMRLQVRCLMLWMRVSD